MMKYKNYIGVIEYDDEDQTFHGRVANIRDVVTFEGDSVAALRRAFRDSVEDYLAFCQSRGEQPDRPFSGKFVTRMSPELHRQASLAAAKARMSLNSWLANVVGDALGKKRTPAKSSKAPRKETMQSVHD
jgi:predicted HicB family RNase H-like nuclease